MRFAREQLLEPSIRYKICFPNKRQYQLELFAVASAQSLSSLFNKSKLNFTSHTQNEIKIEKGSVGCSKQTSYFVIVSI